MKLYETLDNRFGIGLGFLLSRLPPAIGYRIAQWFADLLSTQKNSPRVWAVRANQWIVHDLNISTQELDRLVRDTYRNSARGLYEFWHSLPGKEKVLKMVDFDQSFFSAINQAKAKGEGLILVLPHLANFDLVGHAAAFSGVKLHALSYPQPPGSYRWQNELRKLEGLTITPLSIQALRLASTTLSSGGIVTTGIDRPLGQEHGKYQLRFFGRKATLPVFHVRLALKHNVPISVIGGCKKPGGNYQVWASELIYMTPMDDIIRETVYNAEKLLSISEHDIRRFPDQWAMFYPVWPEEMNHVPR